MFPRVRRLLVVVTAGGLALFGCGATADDDTGATNASSSGVDSASANPSGAGGTSGNATSTSGVAVSGGEGGSSSSQQGDTSPSGGGSSGTAGAGNTSSGGGGGGGAGFDCSQRAFFQPETGAEELSSGAFCDEVFVCLPNAATVEAARAAVPDLECGLDENVFASLSGASCESADFICQWFMVHEVGEDDLQSLCQVTSLTREADSVLCRVYL